MKEKCDNCQCDTMHSDMECLRQISKKLLDVLEHCDIIANEPNISLYYRTIDELKSQLSIKRICK